MSGFEIASIIAAVTPIVIAVLVILYGPTGGY